MVKFHVNDEGNVGVCTASELPCQFGLPSEHSETRKEAEQYAEMKAGIKYGLFPKITKTSISRDSDNINDQSDNVKSAVMSAQYAHHSIVNKHMHNSVYSGNDAEIYYYSTAQGRLELERRMLQDPERKILQDVYSKINDPDFKVNDISKSLDKSEIAVLVEDGYRSFSNFHNDNDERFLSSYRTDVQSREGMKHALVDMSEKWNKLLTVDEQEAVSFSTSSGSRIIQYAAGYRSIDDVRGLLYGVSDIDSFEKDLDYSDWDSHSKLLDNHMSDFASSYLLNFKSALSKSPLLPEPVLAYRGTSQSEIKDMLGIDESVGGSDYMERLNRGEFDGTFVSSSSRLQNIPESASVDVGISRRFGEGIILEIVQRSGSSPVNVSAWGAGEYEMLTNPSSKYKICGSRVVYDDNKDNSFTIIKLDEIRDI